MRIGVFLCEGDEEIKAVINLEQLKQSVSQIPEVEHICLMEETLCSIKGHQKMIEEIKQHNLDHVVVGACTPKLYENKFRKVLEDINVNPANFVVANIREQCVYAHKNDPDMANRKAQLYLKLAIEQVKLTHPLSLEKVPVRKNAVVLGGGWSGMRAAIGIAKKGYKVDILEKSPELGGDLKQMNRLPPKDEASAGALRALTSEVVANENITVHVNSVIKKVSGSVGDYKVLFKQDEQEKSFEAGTVVVAIGHSEYNAREFDKKNNPDVISLIEYNDMLKADGKTGGKILRPSTGQPPSNIAFVQCNGSLDPKKNIYCSKYCCEATASAVRQTRHQFSSLPITVYYKEVRAFNNVSEVYLKDTMTIPGVTYQQGVPEQIQADMVVLANAIEPAADTDVVRRALVLDKDKYGFFREDDFLMNRVATYDPGIFVIGTCSGPKTISERIQDARVASDLASDVLAKDEVINELFISQTNEDLCGGCNTCIRTCLFGAVRNEEREGTKRGVAVVDKKLCRGCGNCVAACPQGARDLVLYTSDLLEKSVDILSEFQLNEPKILIYACNGCAYPALDQATRIGYELPPNLFIVRVPCSGRVDTQFLEYALTHGFDGVMVGMCETNSCHYIGGNEDCCKRIDLLMPLLEAKGIEKERIKLAPVCFSRGEDAVESVKSFLEQIKTLGGGSQ